MQRLDLTLGLLRVNKTIHSEASLLFYSQNRFEFPPKTRAVTSFLKTIGPSNAENIRHIYVDFPEFSDIYNGDFTLYEESVSILNTIQSSCANLSTLTTSQMSSDFMQFTLKRLGNPKVTTGALEMVNSYFRAIPSVPEIIVEVYDDIPDDFIRMEMKSLGWKIVAVHEIKEGGL
ncbi:MAG: hypothetical protein Q9180_002192 [Flavoplaca navasiana]